MKPERTQPQPERCIYCGEPEPDAWHALDGEPAHRACVDRANRPEPEPEPEPRFLCTRCGVSGVGPHACPKAAH